MSTSIDVLIIGSGQAGGPLASAFAAAGKQTVLVERKYIGGTCVNVGCTPTKTMIASGRVSYLARRSDDYGVETSDTSVDMKAVRQRKRDIVQQWRSGSEKNLLGKDNPRTIFGEARFTGPRQVTVALNDGGEEAFEAETVIINVGERPASLNLPGSDQINVLNSTTVMELGDVPEHLILIGGGYTALEFGQLYRRLGAEVTIIHRGSQLLSREDPDIAEAVKDILEEDGITVLLNANSERISGKDGGLTVHVEHDGASRDIRGSHLLEVVGRQPNTDSLDLAAAGIEMDDSRHIPTNERLETNVPGVYAVGDVRPAPKFTHISYDDYRVLQANLIEGEQRTVMDRMVPYTVFIDPQLGRIGMSEKQARERGRDIRVASIPMSSVARAVETAEPRGVMKAIVDAESQQILGASVLGVEGGEIASMIQIAMMGGLPYTALRDGIFPHPGFAEGLNTLFSSLKDAS